MSGWWWTLLLGNKGRRRRATIDKGGDERGRQQSWKKGTKIKAQKDIKNINIPGGRTPQASGKWL